MINKIASAVLEVLRSMCWFSLLVTSLTFGIFFVGMLNNPTAASYPPNQLVLGWSAAGIAISLLLCWALDVELM